MLTLADALEALTNFRPIATTVITEAVIDSYLGMTRQKETRSLPIGGGRGYPLLTSTLLFIGHRGGHTA